MPYILLGEAAYIKYADSLSRLLLTPVPLPPEPRLNNIVNTHADTLIWSDGRVHIINREYIKKLPLELTRYFTQTEDSPMGEYPNDAVFNALTVGKYIFARVQSLSPTIRDIAAGNGYTLVNVNQGYARCSTLALPQANAALTADNGMVGALITRGIDVLTIQCGHVALSGCEYGFIGGASFVDDRTRTVYFFGDISAHPDADRIIQFLKKYGYVTVSLAGTLTDYGGAVII